MLINKEANLRQPGQIAHRDKVCWGFRVQKAKLKPANTYTMIPTATAKYETGLLRYVSIYKDERINLRQPGLHNRNTSETPILWYQQQLQNMRLAYWYTCRSIRMRESISGSLAYTTETLHKSKPIS
jgi:hypothetical protein